MTSATDSALASMRAAGLPEDDARQWSESFPVMTGEFEPDARDAERLLASFGVPPSEAAAKAAANRG